MASSTDLLYLSHADLESRCPDDASVMAAAREGVMAHAAGNAIAQPTLGMQLPDSTGGLFAIRGALIDAGLISVKSIGSFPNNRAQDLAPDTGVMLLYDGNMRMPLAILAGSFITTTRTAAMTALAAITLAPPDASVLACIGGCGIAPLAARMVRDALDISEVRATSASQPSRDATATALSSSQTTVTAFKKVRDCIDGADIVIDGPGLSKHGPLLPSDRLKAGVMVISYGPWSSFDDHILDTVDRVTMDRWAEGTSGPLGPFIADGRFSKDHVDAWFGSMVSGDVPARAANNESLLCWTRGLGVCDITLAQALIASARERGCGVSLPYP
ncbi:MAG: hypothetical protein CMM46_15915 [Rhodospirillaceae bacterium]|nr:hypothetical protein [Rhodospirillaceae bacterium]|tara:strand:+ start:26097 stop:27086 length:990 start_codon:yes stop_codon:yes gene_type:complete